MTGDTIAGLVAAVRDHLAPPLVGADAWMRPALLKRLAQPCSTATPARIPPWRWRSSISPVAPPACRWSISSAARSGARSRRCGSSAMRRRTRTSPRRRRASARGHPLLQAQGRRQAARGRDRRRPCGAQGAGAGGCRSAPTPIAASPTEPRGATSQATAEAGLLFLEQPFEPDDMKGLAALARATPVRDRRRRGHSFAPRHRSPRRGRRAAASRSSSSSSAAFRRRSPPPRCAGASGSPSTSPPRWRSQPRTGGDGAPRLRGRQRRLGRQPHAFLSRRGHRAPAARHGDGRVALPLGPGLGVEVDEAAVARLRAD